MTLSAPQDYVLLSKSACFLLAILDNGREGTSVFWASSFGPENNGQNSTKQGNNGEPSSSPIHHERPPSRAAAATPGATYLVGRLSGLVWWRRRGRGRLGG